jgi:hypothetical protein
MILSQINGIYDPLGLASPFVVRAKIMMRKLWISDPKLDWDNPIPEKCQENWIKFFQDLFKKETIHFERGLKPKNTSSNPDLIIFSRWIK